MHQDTQVSRENMSIWLPGTNDLLLEAQQWQGQCGYHVFTGCLKEHWMIMLGKRARPKTMQHPGHKMKMMSVPTRTDTELETHKRVYKRG